MNGNYENYLIREMSETGRGGSEGEIEPEEMELDKVESFSAWLDAQGDALAPADSFDQWLDQTGDKI